MFLCIMCVHTHTLYVSFLSLMALMIIWREFVLSEFFCMNIFLIVEIKQRRYLHMHIRAHVSACTCVQTCMPVSCNNELRVSSVISSAIVAQSQHIYHGRFLISSAIVTHLSWSVPDFECNRNTSIMVGS